MLTLEYLRSFKVIDFALFDLFAAFIGVLLLSPLLIRLFRLVKLEIPVISWICFTLPIGFVTHLVIGNRTPMTTQILDLSGQYSIKILFLVLFFIGVYNMSIIKK